VNAINDKSHPNSSTNIHASAGYSGGDAQIPQANTIKDKSCPNSTTTIHNSSGYTGGAAQIQHVNAMNGKSRPNSTTHRRRHCINSTDAKSNNYMFEDLFSRLRRRIPT